MGFIEGVRFIRPGTVDGNIDLLAIPPNWIGWHHAEVADDCVRVPAQKLTGERVVIELSNACILTECGAPSVEEFVAKKQKDYPPSGDNTYAWI